MTLAAAASTRTAVRPRHIRRSGHGRANRPPAQEATLCVTTLGRFRCVRAGVEVREVRDDAALASVIVLVATRDAIHREELVDYCRNGHDGDAALTSVLDRVRTHLGPDWVDESNEEIRIASGLQLDVRNFLASFDAAHYADAAAVYAGAFLPGFEQQCAPGLARWIRRMRERLATLHQVARERARLCAMVEALGDAVVLRSSTGTLYCSASADSAVEAGLRTEFERLAEELGRGPASLGVFAAARHVTVEAGEFRIAGCVLSEPEPSNGSSFLFTVRRLSPIWPSDDDLARRFALTRKECRVAQLLAYGSPNAEIARTLFISPHTARRHTENVLLKLGLSSRARVATVILGTAPDAAGLSSSPDMITRS